MFPPPAADVLSLKAVSPLGALSLTSFPTTLELAMINPPEHVTVVGQPAVDRVPESSTRLTPDWVKLPWACDSCSCCTLDCTPEANRSPLWNEVPTTLPVMLISPFGTVAVPKKNGWHGAAKGWVAVLRHPLGDQNRLCTWTILFGAARPPVHVTMTVTRYGFAMPLHPEGGGQLFVSYVRQLNGMLFCVIVPWCRTSGETQSGVPTGQAAAEATTFSPDPGVLPAVHDLNRYTPAASPAHPVTRFASPLRSELRWPATILSQARPRACSMI